MEQPNENWLERFLAGAEPGPVAVIVAHPDDETIGAGSRLPLWRDRVKLVHVTDGAPRDLRDAIRAGFKSAGDYGRARRSELLAALKLAGIARRQSFKLNTIDQRSCFEMPEIARELLGILTDFKPRAVVTHAYEGGHPDHDAVAFAVHMACRRLWNGPGAPPVIVEMPLYHNRDGLIETQTFLPQSVCRERNIRLNEEEKLLKRRMIDCFVSQRLVLAYFGVDEERFRIAPDYDFCAPPHEGALFYELLGWDMSGTQWRALARAALEQLGVACTV